MWQLLNEMHSLSFLSKRTWEVVVMESSEGGNGVWSCGWLIKVAHTVVEVGVGVLHIRLMVAVVIDMEVENKWAGEAERGWGVLVVTSLEVEYWVVTCKELANWVVVDS